ncbi:uncharacterized protein LOC129574839 [Sitodiplosis mosellana]|uniref:uncharacterized protein LOC129574839 n=1 Tax=Sitodiplosis mosellana TaxID=263140 RepID=UPI0024437F90|nr:uncharacterized protein LOC129574839 [Sitodiplosis mosellana]
MEKLAKAPMIRRSLTKVTNTQSTTSLTDMNDDCLTSVFDYLDTANLVNLTKTNKRLNNIVTHRVIPRKIVQLDMQRSPIRAMMKLFGGTITRISIYAHNRPSNQPCISSFAEIFHLLTVYGTPGKLQQLTINGLFDKDYEISSNEFENFRPYLENIHTLSIGVKYFENVYIKRFMKNIPKQNLRHLSLDNIPLSSKWLSVQSLPRLRNICMYVKVNGQNLHSIGDKLTRYIAEKPQLSTFDVVRVNVPTHTFMSQMGIEYELMRQHIQIELSRHVPNITQSGTAKTNSMVDQPTSVTGQSVTLANRSYGKAKWEHLDNFTNLKNFSLKTHAKDFRDAGEVFRILAERNTIGYLESISGFIPRTENTSYPVQFDHLRRMTHVKSLQLVDFGRLHSDNFVGKLFENLTRL